MTTLPLPVEEESAAIPAPTPSPPPVSVSTLESTVQRMLSHPKMFNGFIDILKLPSIQATLSTLTNSCDPQKQRRHDALIRTLELFAYGTVGEYLDLIDQKDDSTKSVWTLNDTMLEKLRMLTVVSVVIARRTELEHGGSSGEPTTMREVEMNVEMKMADAALCERKHISHQIKSNQMRVRRTKGTRIGDNNMISIPYSHLASQLRMPYPNVTTTNHDDNTNFNNEDESKSSKLKKESESKHNIRQLEDLLIKCIYSNILSAKLDQVSQCLIVQPHIALVSTPTDFVGWKLFFEGSLLTDSSSSSTAPETESVYGSSITRDLHTLTPRSTSMEIARMSSSLRHFLTQSNTLLETLERLSNTTVMSRRNDDDCRWAEVRKVMEEAPSRIRSLASPSTTKSTYYHGSTTSSSSSSPMHDSGHSYSMRAWEMGMDGGSVEDGSEGGGESKNVTEVVGSNNNMGRRQVKRSKGGHSMMMNE